MWRSGGWPAKRQGDGTEERRETSYLLYLTGNDVFLKGLTMRDGGRDPLPHCSPHAARPPVFKKMFNAVESKTR